MKHVILTLLLVTSTPLAFGGNFLNKCKLVIGGKYSYTSQSYKTVKSLVEENFTVEPVVVEQGGRGKFQLIPRETIKGAEAVRIFIDRLEGTRWSLTITFFGPVRSITQQYPAIALIKDVADTFINTQTHKLDEGEHLFVSSYIIPEGRYIKGHQESSENLNIKYSAVITDADHITGTQDIAKFAAQWSALRIYTNNSKLYEVVGFLNSILNLQR